MLNSDKWYARSNSSAWKVTEDQKIARSLGIGLLTPFPTLKLLKLMSVMPSKREIDTFIQGYGKHREYPY